MPYKYVTVEGTVTEIKPSSHDDVLPLAIHYLGEETVGGLCAGQPRRRSRDHPPGPLAQRGLRQGTGFADRLTAEPHTGMFFSPQPAPIARAPTTPWRPAGGCRAP